MVGVNYLLAYLLSDWIILEREKMILAGDLGGTKAILAVFEENTGFETPLIKQSLPSRNYQNFYDLLKDFLSQHENLAINKASFGVAGPILNGVASISNLGWQIEEAKLGDILKTKQVKLLNDLESMSYSVLLLKEKDLETLNPGKPIENGNIAVLAAGTGLGEGFLVWNNGRYHAVASEGGHVDFAPRNEVEMELLRFLWKKLGHVSYERIVSGMGISNIYEFVKNYRNYQEPASLASRFQNEDPNAVITELGMAGTNPICEETLNIFLSAYGAEAGNLALKVMSTRGVFIGGGIAPKILQKFKENFFMDAFLNKGRFVNVLKNFPVKIILNQDAALIGAAHYTQLFF